MVIKPTDLPDLTKAAIVHASGISMAISPSACDTVLAAFEKAPGKVSFDSNLRLRLWPLARARAMIAAAASMADYFFPSLEDARQLSGAESAEDNLAWAHRLGNAVDATGAGDCFCGAALARLAAGDSIWQAARYANAAAALATTGYGAVDPIPRPDAVTNVLN